MKTATMLASLLALAPCGVLADEPVSLKGISKIQVEVKFVEGGGTGSCSEPSIAKSFLLAEDQVRTDTELRLRQVGLVVTSTSPALYILVTGCMMPALGVGVINAEVSFWESATINRKGIAIPATVTGWRTSNYKIISAGDRSISAESEDLIQSLVSKFINAWLAANPKPR